MGLVIASNSIPDGSKCCNAWIEATYAVNISGVLTPGCSNRVTNDSLVFSMSKCCKLFLCKQIRRSSIALYESGYSMKCYGN